MTKCKVCSNNEIKLKYKTPEGEGELIATNFKYCPECGRNLKEGVTDEKARKRSSSRSSQKK